MKRNTLPGPSEPCDDPTRTQPAKNVVALSQDDVTAQQLPTPSDDELSWTGLFALVGIINVAMLLVTLSHLGNDACKTPPAETVQHNVTYWRQLNQPMYSYPQVRGRHS
jgi:hypothetical protein